jgi:hypothetical protein
MPSEILDALLKPDHVSVDLLAKQNLHVVVGEVAQRSPDEPV